jgi:hypothetical protein
MMSSPATESASLNGLTLRTRPDKIASVCLPFQFGPTLNVQPEPECREGSALVCRVLTERSVYGDLELVSGRAARLLPGDIIVGVLGNRAALRGFSGRVPESIQQGEELHLLNLGGVIGKSEGLMVGLGEPIRLKVLGTPLLKGKPARLEDWALPEPYPSSSNPKIIAVAGTCMNSGKSTAAAAMIRHFRAKGLLVHAGKATGVGAIKDPLSFRDHGASLSLSFLDCGVPSTAYYPKAAELAGKLLDHLAAEDPDVIVLELGDGLLGAYGVDEILADEAFQARTSTVILAANDVVGGWAGSNRLTDMGYSVSVVTGPATDNPAGVLKLESMGIPAANILREPGKLTKLVEEGVGL